MCEARRDLNLNPTTGDHRYVRVYNTVHGQNIPPMVLILLGKIQLVPFAGAAATTITAKKKKKKEDLAMGWFFINF